jgi:hypothetical protein
MKNGRLSRTRPQASCSGKECSSSSIGGRSCREQRRKISSYGRSCVPRAGPVCLARGARWHAPESTNRCDFRRNICSGETNHPHKLAPLRSGETHEQICDPGFDTGHIRDRAGCGSHDHTSQGRDKQQRGTEGTGEDPKEPSFQQSQVSQSGAACYRTFQSGRRGLRGRCPKLRLQAVASSNRRGS